MQLCTHLSTTKPQPFAGQVSLEWPGLQLHTPAPPACKLGWAGAVRMGKERH